MKKFSTAVLVTAMTIAGFAHAQEGIKPPVELHSLEDARSAFEDIVRVYERGDVLSFQRQLDASLIGRERMVDVMQREANALRNVRVHLSDIKLSAGTDVAVVQVRWEKRFLAATDLQPGLQSGNSVVLMHREKGGWRMASVSGDNLFGGPSGARGLLTISPSSIAVADLPTGAAAAFGSFVVEVQDADLVGSNSVSVVLTTAAGDREVLSLNAVGAGVFRNSATSFLSAPGGGVSQGNNVVDVTGSTTLSVTYLDQTPGGGSPSVTLVRRIPVR